MRMRWRWRLLWYLFAAAYVLWPVDLIPDFLGPIGYLDDALVVAITAFLTLRRWRERVHGPRRAGRGDAIDVPKEGPRP